MRGGGGAAMAVATGAELLFLAATLSGVSANTDSDDGK